ncbi:PQQ-binding-like beta-propeller repeat protein [Aquabacterium sp.]|uniref:PQQ-binding-like beta-propeller repeat protein n=1 Tax=Aquabacterium sp. TaxID=1872578 RepID=UPI0035B3888C
MNLFPIMTSSAIVSAVRRSQRSLISAVALGVVAAALTACGSTKPQPAPLENLTPTQKVSVLWSQRIGSADGFTNLAVTGTTVAWATTDGQVVSLDATTGATRWRGQVDAKVAAGVGSDGRYAAVVTTENELVVMDQGKVLWRDRQPGRVITAPLVAGERVFVQGVDRSVRAYDVKDGRWLWQYQRPGSDPLSLSAPGLLQPYRNTLAVGQGSRLVGLDPTRGSVLFDLSLGTPRGTNEVERLADLVGPGARVGDSICVRAYQLSVGCVDMSRGRLVWTKPQTGAAAVGASASLVVGADSADRLSAWRTDSGDVRWRVDRFQYRGLSAPTVWGELVAVADHDGYLHVLSAADGRTVARISLDNTLSAAPVLIDNILIVATRSGTVYGLRAN